MKLLRYCFLMAIVCMAADNSYAALEVYDNGTDISTVGGYCSDCNSNLTDWRVFDNFSLGAATTLTGIEFEAGLNANTTFIDISIWSAPNSGLLYSVTVPISDFTSTQNTFDGSYDNFTLSIDLPNWNLGTGSYWLSLFGPSMSIPIGNAGNFKQLFIPTGQLFDRDYEAPFRLYGENGVVPEPATILVWSGLGVVATGTFYAKKRKSTPAI